MNYNPIFLISLLKRPYLISIMVTLKVVKTELQSCGEFALSRRKSKLNQKQVLTNCFYTAVCQPTVLLGSETWTPIWSRLHQNPREVPHVTRLKAPYLCTDICNWWSHPVKFPPTDPL